MAATDAARLRLLEIIAPIRKKAGKVRDIDVFTGFVAKLANDSNERLTRLLEHRGAKLLKNARRLRDAKSERKRDGLRRNSGFSWKKYHSFSEERVQ